MREPSTLTEMEQTSARVLNSLDSDKPNGIGFMINRLIDWSQRSLLQDLAFSIICIQKKK